MKPTELLKGALKGFLSRPSLLKRVGRRRFIFCYHDVSESSSQAHSLIYSTPPDLFRRHVAALSAVFEWVSLDELVEGGEVSRPTAAITFDDGFLSVRDVALPILKAAGIPVAIFVCKMAAERNFLPVSTRHLISGSTKWRKTFAEFLVPSEAGYGFIRHDLDQAMLDRVNEIEAAGVLDERVYLSASDIGEMNRQGVLVGSHSAAHRVLRLLGPKELDVEVRENIQFLSTIGIASRHFAVPFGKKEHYSPAVLDALKRHGYRAVYTTNPRDIRLDGADFTLVPRISVTSQSVEELSFCILRTLFQDIDL